MRYILVCPTDCDKSFPKLSKEVSWKSSVIKQVGSFSMGSNGPVVQETLKITRLHARFVPRVKNVPCTNITKRKRSMPEDAASESVPEERMDTSKFPWPITYPSDLPSTPNTDQEIITVDAYATNNHYADLIVGRARPNQCLDPNIRPLVRAKLVHQNFNDPTNLRVFTFIPAKYGKVPNRTGELQIPIDGVEYLSAFDGNSKRERSANMLSALKKHDANNDDDDEFEVIDTYAESSFLDWDVIIGYARPTVCADPAVRPLVRAALTEDDRVVQYMPASYGVDKNRAGGELQVAMRDVKLWREFDAPTESQRRLKIKEALVKKRGVRVGGGCAGVGTGGCKEGLGECMGGEEVET